MKKSTESPKDTATTAPTTSNSIKSNIHLPITTLSLPTGKEILKQTHFDLIHGRIYGLLGRNGVGKSFLLSQLATKNIPGIPPNTRILYLEQELLQGSVSQTALEVLLQSDEEQCRLLQERTELELKLENEDVSPEELNEIVMRLNDLEISLDSMNSYNASERAVAILQELNFTKEMMHQPTIQLSGGYRMRLALARIRFCSNSYDILLLDECTNHLDIAGLEWLTNVILEQCDSTTIMIVSHDRVFLDSVCTDIILMANQRLEYHPGNYSEFVRQKQEKISREAQILDSSERQRHKAETFIQSQQQQSQSSSTSHGHHKKGIDPNKQRQAKMMREKKLDRIGNYREDGKRYKQYSLKKLSEEYLRTPQKVQIELDDPSVKIHLQPIDDWPPSISIDDAIVSLEDFSIGYIVNDENGSQRKELILEYVDLCVQRGSKIAIVGKNGEGKTTLAQLLSGILIPNDHPELFFSSGTIWKHPNIRISMISQYSIEELETYQDLTVYEYAMTHLVDCKAVKTTLQKAHGNIHQYLGGYGLGGPIARKKISMLSGGERMRLCYAIALSDQPHLLILDESTNHMDLETQESLVDTLRNFDGSVVIVSHNQAFLSGFCNLLWMVEGGFVRKSHGQTETFDEIFGKYRKRLNDGGTKEVRHRYEQQDLMKKVNKLEAKKTNVAMM